MPPLSEGKLRAYGVPDTRDRYGARESILYALGVGAGLGDIDETALLYEDNLRALPSQALVLGTPGFWLMEPELGLDWPQILHGEQSFKLHKPLRASGDLLGKTWIGPAGDKGPGKPALLHCTRHLYDVLTTALVAELEEVWVLRDAGGFGGKNLALTVGLEPLPETPANRELTLPTARNQPALYRLTGDRNPLHINAAVAARGGFARPILHGLSTMGVIARALVHGVCGGDYEKLTAMRLRFTAPVYPGDAIRTEIWEQGADVRFRASVPARGVIVADLGSADCRGFAN